MAFRATSARLVSIAAFVVIVGGCDTGSAFVAENKTDQELVARVTGQQWPPGTSSVELEPRQDVLVLPAQSRVAIELLSFSDTFRVEKIEILTADCVVVATFEEPRESSWADGHVIVIEPGPTAALHHDFPEKGTLAATTDRCSDATRG